MASPGQTAMTEVIIVEAPQAADHARCAGAPQSAGLPAYVGTASFCRRRLLEGRPISAEHRVGAWPA